MSMLLAWTLRFSFFAFGDPSPFAAAHAMIVCGCAFDFFNISGSVFVEQGGGLKYSRQRAGELFT